MSENKKHSKQGMDNQGHKSLRTAQEGSSDDVERKQERENFSSLYLFLLPPLMCTLVGSPGKEL